jgi:hypothetical protein
METTPRRRKRPNWLRGLAGLLVVAFLAINVLAFVQARAATTFVPDGEPLEALLTQPLPQQLGALLTGVRIPRPVNRATPADHYLPYETRTIPLANGEQLEAWYVPQPQPRGIALMFVGYAGVKEGALTPAAKLYQWGYSSLLVDFRGVGGSSRNDQTLGIREAEDVSVAFAYAKTQWPDLPVLLYGVSMGGAAVLRAAAEAGVRPAGMILEAVFDNLLTTTHHRFDALGLPGSPAAELLLFWGGVQLGANPFAHNPVDYAASVDVPVLLLYGEGDPWVLSPEREALAAALRGPVEVVNFPGQGHGGPYVYGDPERWDATVRAFIDRL